MKHIIKKLTQRQVEKTDNIQKVPAGTEMLMFDGKYYYTVVLDQVNGCMYFEKKTREVKQ